MELEEDENGVMQVDGEADDDGTVFATEGEVRRQEEHEGRYMYRTGEFKLSHTTPQCDRCRRALELIGESGDLTNVDGLYVPCSGCFMHYSCYKALCDEERSRREAREDAIVADMKLAMTNHQVQVYCTYDWTNPNDFRYCSYCQGQLTARWSGYCYPCSDEAVKRDWRNYGFVHFTCYDKVRSQGKYNPEPAAKPPRLARDTPSTSPLPLLFTGVTPKPRVVVSDVLEEIEETRPIAGTFSGTRRRAAASSSSSKEQGTATV